MEPTPTFLSPKRSNYFQLLEGFTLTLLCSSSCFAPSGLVKCQGCPEIDKKTVLFSSPPQRTPNPKFPFVVIESRWTHSVQVHALFSASAGGNLCQSACLLCQSVRVEVLTPSLISWEIHQNYSNRDSCISPPSRLQHLSVAATRSSAHGAWDVYHQSNHRYTCWAPDFSFSASCFSLEQDRSSVVHDDRL